MRATMKVTVVNRKHAGYLTNPELADLSIRHEKREQTIQFLEQKDLLQRVNEMIGKSGVIGEETNSLLMYLIFTSRKREHPLSVRA